MKSLFLAACVFSGMVSAVSALTFDCEFKDGSDGGAVPPRIILAVDEVKNAASAYDGYIDQVHGVPIPVKYVKESETRHRFDWTLKGLKGGNRTYVISYTARVNPKSMTATLSGRLHGFDNQIKGYGKCKMVK